MADPGGRMHQIPEGVRDIGNNLDASMPGRAAQAAKTAAAALTSCPEQMPGCQQLVTANGEAAQHAEKFDNNASNGLLAYKGIAHGSASDYENGDQIGQQAITKALQFDTSDLEGYHADRADIHSALPAYDPTASEGVN